MGTAWHSMWYGLVLAYQLVVQGNCNGRTAGMFGETVMAEQRTITTHGGRVQPL
jgi:hypothetical protein